MKNLQLRQRARDHRRRVTGSKPSVTEDPRVSADSCGHGSLVVKITDSWPACHDIEPITAEDPPCRGVMQVKSVENPNVLPMVWCGS
ncbi:hypothetical protein TNCV_1957561 [Trichonephila clavipes]|nr:hypothetical protein TNCV_1957561 [Trichonephila clavipes]